MNYFAHLHIASLTQTSWAGNLLGDFPVQAADLEEDLLEGWRLHQAVDVWVDDHQASQTFRALPRQGRRRFAGIVQDIAMDYWLIRYWSNFSDEALSTFCQRAVRGLAEDKARCPSRLQGMIQSLQETNWLANLGRQEGVEKAIYSIMRRWRHGHHLQAFVDELPMILAQAEQPFLQLYPELLAFVEEYKKAEQYK